MPKETKNITIYTGGQNKHCKLPVGRFPRILYVNSYSIKDGYVYFNTPNNCDPLYNKCWVNSSLRRRYILDCRINPWDRPDWKDEWPRYSNHHSYTTFINHRYRDKLIRETTDGLVTKHHLIKAREK